MRRVTVLAMTALTSLALVASAAASAGAATTETRLSFRTTLTSAGTSLVTLPGGHTYGWNDLRGSTSVGGEPADVSFLGDVDYIDGSGPFNGYVTLTMADGTKLGLRVAGHALAVPTAGDAMRTQFVGDVTVIGGTGPYRGARGIGTMTGVRKAALGSPVALAFRLTMVGR